MWLNIGQKSTWCFEETKRYQTQCENNDCNSNRTLQICSKWGKFLCRQCYQLKILDELYKGKPSMATYFCQCLTCITECPDAEHLAETRGLQFGSDRVNNATTRHDDPDGPLAVLDGPLKPTQESLDSRQETNDPIPSLNAGSEIAVPSNQENGNHISDTTEIGHTTASASSSKPNFKGQTTSNEVHSQCSTSETWTLNRQPFHEIREQVEEKMQQLDTRCRNLENEVQEQKNQIAVLYDLVSHNQLHN